MNEDIGHTLVWKTLRDDYSVNNSTFWLVLMRANARNPQDVPAWLALILTGSQIQPDTDQRHIAPHHCQDRRTKPPGS